jgi:hypothetical protein
MGWRVEWRVTCDHCGKLGPRGPEEGSRGAEVRAARAGWAEWEGFYGTFHACPRCKGLLSDGQARAQTGGGDGEDARA